jgi:hypothetical protein
MESFPGSILKIFDIRVKINASYVSRVESKIEAGISLQDGPGHPSNLDRFEIAFIRDVLEQQQITSKAVLLSTVQLLIRVVVLIKRGAVAVEALDERVVLKSGKKGKRSRKRQDDSDSDTDDDDDADIHADRLAREESFRTIKKMLGDACNMSLAETGISRYPTR